VTGTAPLSEVLGPPPTWTASAAVAAAVTSRTVTFELRPAAVERSLPALVAALPGPGALAVLLAVAGAMVLLALAHHGRDRDRLGAGTGVVALLVVAAAATGGIALRTDASGSGVLPSLAAQGGSAQLSMTVVAEPRPIARGWHVLVRVDEVEGIAVRERAALVVEQNHAALGDRWRATASARPLPAEGYGSVARPAACSRPPRPRGHVSCSGQAAAPPVARSGSGHACGRQPRATSTSGRGVCSSAS
jgi:hypothetical protein